MKKLILILFINFSFFQISFACDICGCFMGITPYDNQSSFGLYHRYRSFSAYEGQTPTFFPKTTLNPSLNPQPLPIHKHGAGHGTETFPDTDFETFSTLELRGKYFIHNRIEINGILPYNMNRLRTGDSLYKLNAIGDINLFAGFHLIKPDEYKKIQQRLILGAGIKLATGHYYIGWDEYNRQPLLNQPGTGSNDIMFYTNYVFGFKKWGLSTNLSYKINGKNYFNEKIDNSFTNYTNIFYKFKKGDFIFIPSAQIYYEYTNGLMIENVLQEGTKMNQLMLGPGFDFFYKNIGFNSNFQFTLYEDLYEGNVQSVCRFMFGISFNFNQKNYLLNKKSE
jgi:hypothetical protein